MSRGSIIFWLGFILILTPFLGIPLQYKWGILVLVGSILLLVGYWQRRAEWLQNLHGPNGERHSDTFVETTKPLFNKDTLE